MNILKQADNIVNDERINAMYGGYAKCNERIAKLMTIFTGKEITVEDIFYLEVAMKLAREIQHHKEENLLDTVAYLGALNDYLETNLEK